jgi:serine/threonine protein kinase
MAEVWLAERADGAFERELALKLPRLTRLRRDLAARFRHERDILARLEHPNIARFYDAGVSSDGSSAHDIGPEPYPRMYLIMLTNTALADYALGYFDESLRLYDRALGFTQKVQSARDEAYCLYGIGVNAHAIGSAPG